MSYRKLAIMTAVPLLWASLAAAQPAPSDEAGTPPAMGSGMAQHQMDPAVWHKKMCGERYAHEAGYLSYLEAKLNLTEQQKSAWNKWHQVMLDSAAKQRDACLEDTPKPGTMPTAVEHEAMMEKHLSLRLKGLEASRQPLEALYQTLTPEQRAILDHPHGHLAGMARRFHDEMHGHMGGMEELP